MIKAIFALVLCIAGIYSFFTFDSWMNTEFISQTVEAKNRMYRTFQFFLSQNKYGYWLVRCLTTLVPSYLFGSAFIGIVRGEKGW